MKSLKDKIVLITGGTGSFGSTFLQRLLESDEPSKIIVFSRDEKKQHDMRLKFNNSKIKFEIGDIRDQVRIQNAMKDVNFVFHAAAMKQVPSCEFFPMEAVQTNIIGTNNVIEAAIYQNVNKVVVLSTDKAAYPVNAMGCSKMMMEKIMIAKSQELSSSKTILCGVRYGNVLYSRGSVVPLFVKQIAERKPLTVTHPDMTRFLMPLYDAVDLVLHALEMGKNGDLFIRKAPAASILDLAVATKNIFSSKSIIKNIGIRAGEKMHETLATSEELYRAEDQNEFWRIRSENEKSINKYFTQGVEELNKITPYDSENAKRLNVTEIENLLMSLPEISSMFNNA